MTEFASAAMVRVLRAGMHELGLDPPAAAAGSSEGLARIDLDHKRRLVTAAVAQAGWACLPLLGRGLHRHSQEPTHAALASARDPADLWARWQRLERYIHSSHRIEIISTQARSAVLRHVASPARPAPLPAEDLVVLGVLAALLETLGATQVTVTIGRCRVYPQPDAEGLARLVQREATDTWRFVWRGSPGHRRLTPPVADDAAPPSLLETDSWPDPARRVAQVLASDLMRPATLPELAAAVGLAPRTLQRSLADHGWSRSRVLAECRLWAAGWYLIDCDAALAEIGFLCGYSDQSHFTRDFKQRVGLTPAQYRADFRHRV